MHVFVHTINRNAQRIIYFHQLSYEWCICSSSASCIREAKHRLRRIFIENWCSQKQKSFVFFADFHPLLCDPATKAWAERYILYVACSQLPENQPSSRMSILRCVSIVVCAHGGNLPWDLFIFCVSNVASHNNNDVTQYCKTGDLFSTLNYYYYARMNTANILNILPVLTTHAHPSRAAQTKKTPTTAFLVLLSLW